MRQMNCAWEFRLRMDQYQKPLLIKLSLRALFVRMHGLNLPTHLGKILKIFHLHVGVRDRGLQASALAQLICSGSPSRL
jgi:hypothetical protein